MEEASARRGAYVRSVTMPVWFSICWIIALCTGSAVIGGFCLPLIAVVFMIIGKSLSKPDRRGEKPGKA
jgi:hypothetical protein